MFYWIKTHFLIKKIFSGLIWDIKGDSKTVYLTFDDGPTPEITEWTLSQLKKYDFKATFFCIGNNILKHPEIFNQIISDNHAIGNHTFNHVNGWKTNDYIYVNEVKDCENSISKLQKVNTNLLRPPYGKIKKSQARALKQMGYNIIMWDVLSADFDCKISKERCLKNVLKNVTSGSIIVFHDSKKAFGNLEYVLPKTLAFLKENGFESKAITLNQIRFGLAPIL